MFSVNDRPWSLAIGEKMVIQALTYVVLLAQYIRPVRIFVWARRA